MLSSQPSLATYYRRPLPRVFSWAFRNPSKTKLGSTPKNRLQQVAASNSSLDTMTSLDTPHTNGTSNGVAHDAEPTITTSTSSPFDPAIFRSYLLALLPPFLAATPQELEYLFDDDEFDERVQRFVSEGGSSIYVVKKKEESDGELPQMLRLIFRLY